MYESYYGLRESPFKLTPNPRFLLLTAGHAEALNSVKYGISSRRGIVLLIGDAGTGKSTILRASTASTTGHRFVEINDPSLTRDEFRQHLADGFGVGSTKRFLTELTDNLTALAEQGVQTALIVDEAHALSVELFEQIRLLSNIETDNDKLLPVVLAGQGELATRLNDPALRQLKQRVALRCTLSTLHVRETAAYIAGRVNVAGGEAATIFNKEAVLAIHSCSQGIPRTISVICDNAMITGFAADERPIGRNTVIQACRDLDINVPEYGRTHAAPSRIASQTRLTSPVAMAAASREPERLPDSGRADVTGRTEHSELLRRLFRSHREAVQDRTMHEPSN